MARVVDERAEERRIAALGKLPATLAGVDPKPELTALTYSSWTGRLDNSGIAGRQETYNTDRPRAAKRRSRLNSNRIVAFSLLLVAGACTSYKHPEKASTQIAFGTDVSNFPHGLNARQFAWQVRYGQTPMEAIRSATVSAADLIGRGNDAGSLEPGKWADLIAVQGDPLADVFEDAR